MSTEARRAPIPPRPTDPPPGHPKDTPADPQSPGAQTARPKTNHAESGQDLATAGSSARGTTAEPAPRRGPAPERTAAVSVPGDGDLDDEPSVFAPRASRTSAGRSAGEGQPQTGLSEAVTGASGSRFPGRRSFAVPEATDPVSPPPPPASARFPDAPPSTNRDGAATPVPPRPAHRPGPQGGRPGGPAQSPSETTARLRPIRSGPQPQRSPSASSSASTGHRGSAQERASGSPGSSPTPPAPAREGASSATLPRAGRPGARVESPTETTARLRPIPSGPQPQRSDAASVPASRREEPSPAQATGRPAPSPVPPPISTARGPRTAWSASDPAHPGSPPSASPDPALSWSAGAAARPVVSFGDPEGYDERMRARPLGLRMRPRTAAAAACLVLGLGLIGGAVTGSWLTGDGGDGTAGSGFSAAATLWHSVPVDRLFPPTLQGTGAGPGGADRTWTRIAVAPDSRCVDAFDPLLNRALAPVGCQRLLRATYTDATQSYVTTVGLLFTKGDSAAMSALATRFRDEHLDRRSDLIPRPYAAKGTAAAGFGDPQRATWTISVLTDAPVVTYAVSGWADGRTVDSPQPAADAVRSGATTAPAQAGLGNEAQGLADRIERRLRQTAGSATEKPS
ncbi:hypothetical protein [Streptomyces sp. NPDC007905]|uniref:hypothetical protein n=1 Tax=Streptomyces sp. NPDC007905 TaxID=3364788 RepID=UPI0036F1225B